MNAAAEHSHLDLADIRDRQFMGLAMHQARVAQQQGEVPVGAVVVKDDTVVARAHNRNLLDTDPTAHAEILALRQAARSLGNHRLVDATLYVTLEPCPMCAGAIVHARVARVVYATPDPRTGAAGSIVDLLRSPDLNHRCEVTAGICQHEAAEMLREFFRARRGKGSETNE